MHILHFTTTLSEFTEFDTLFQAIKKSTSLRFFFNLCLICHGSIDSPFNFFTVYLVIFAAVRMAILRRTLWFTAKRLGCLKHTAFTTDLKGSNMKFSKSSHVDFISNVPPLELIQPNKFHNFGRRIRKKKVKYDITSYTIKFYVLGELHFIELRARAG